jgi:hypothetical protein
MTSMLLCTCFGACQADRTCARLPRFQAYLDTTAQDSQHPRIRRYIEACATHLGTMVVAMATWAHEQDLTNVDLIVLTIEPPLRECHSRRRHPHHDRAQTSGLVFSVVHLGEPETMAADMRHSVSDATEQCSSGRQAGLCTDQLPYVGFLTVGGSGVRTLMSSASSYDPCDY